MFLESAILISGYTTTSVLLAMYTITLIRVRRGSRYTFVSLLLILLIISSIFLLIWLFSYQKLFLQQDNQSRKEVYVWLLSVSLTFSIMAFNLSYFHLAW